MAPQEGIPFILVYLQLRLSRDKTKLEILMYNFPFFPFPGRKTYATLVRNLPVAH